MHDLHKDLKEAIRFVPADPLPKPRMPFVRTASSAEATAALAGRLQAYLRALVSNGQWMTAEAAVLRHFLQATTLLTIFYNILCYCILYRAAPLPAGEYCTIL